MKSQLIFFLLNIILLSCNEKETKKIELVDEIIEHPPAPKKIDPDNLIGFTCNYSGESSEPIKLFSKLIQNKKYPEIRKRLYDKKPAIRYLAVIACKDLETLGIIKLNVKERYLILLNRFSPEKISICSGCSYHQEISMKEMFRENMILTKEAESWINEIIVANSNK